MKNILTILLLSLPFSSYSASIVFGTFTLPEQHVVKNGTYRAGQVMSLDLNLANSSKITTTYVDCNGLITAGQGGSYYHVGLPKTVSISGKSLSVSVGGDWHRDSSDNNFNYYTSRSLPGYGTNKPCSLNQRENSQNVPPIAIAIVVPSGILSGVYQVDVPVVLGLGSNYWNIPQNAYNYRLDAHKAGGIASATRTHLSKISITLTILGGACTSNHDTFDIKHGSLPINSAAYNYAKTEITIDCTSPVTATFTLVSNTPPAYHLAFPSVGLGNGWDSIINIGTPGNAYGNYDNQKTWYNPTKKFVLEVGSVLYGESDKIKPGHLSGSMTLIMSIN